MKKAVIILIIVTACLFVAISASAVTDYLWAYSSWVTSSAAKSAMDYTPPIKLSEEEMSIFRLGFACGYDTAKNIDESFSLPQTESNTVLTRTSIIYDDKNENSEVYIVNTETNKFHKPGCSAEKKILPEHRKEIHSSFNEVRQMGYSPCGICLKNGGN